MIEQFRDSSRKRGRALLAALVALVAAITGCDEKPDWRGVGTDSRDRGQAVRTDAVPGEPAHGQSR